MTTPKRRCKNCEYFVQPTSWQNRCYFNPPQLSGDRGEGASPKTKEGAFCSKWEPKWHENPMLKEAWEEFLMVHKLITSGEEKV